jgi:arsenate reductase-like glutaredoxin family protein
LQKKGIELELRDLGRQRLTAEELDALIGERDYREFLNSRNELYRKRNMKERPPTRAEALRWMAAEPNLIRRPVVIAGRQIILGYDEAKWKALTQA